VKNDKLMMNVKYALAATLMAAMIVFGCSKEAVVTGNNPPSKRTDGFTEYIIPQGAHFSNNEGVVNLSTSQYRFEVYFDSTAIYTVPTGDQDDINKLSGFADNASVHLQYSARFGWRWSENRLRLFGYVHNNGQIQEKEIGVIEIGKIYTCSIKVNGSSYVFDVAGLNSVTLPRAATTAKAEGYRLYPYFGGDNAAPHEIHIWLKYLP
jgi:hypothetical protein